MAVKLHYYMIYLLKTDYLLDTEIVTVRDTNNYKQINYYFYFRTEITGGHLNIPISLSGTMKIS